MAADGQGLTGTSAVGKCLNLLAQLYCGRMLLFFSFRILLLLPYNKIFFPPSRIEFLFTFIIHDRFLVRLFWIKGLGQSYHHLFAQEKE